MKRKDGKPKRMKKTKEEIDTILDRAMGYVKSVPYKVSLRWLFYRLYQDGTYKDKEEYDNFIPILSRARKTQRRGWALDTLEDDTRRIIWRGVGDDNKEEWIENLEINLDKFRTQNYFVMILFEARAMFDQFAYYTKGIPLVPFGGDASIPIKNKIALAIIRAKIKYKKPIVILYFGDCDTKGEQIRDSALSDIKKWISWSDVDFEDVYCGLTAAQASEFNLPTDPDKPAQYQWEALTDKQAMKIITKNVKKYQNIEEIEKIEKQEQRILNWAKKKLQ